MARAEPDGHTLLMPALGNVVLQPLLSKNAGADLLAKLRPVSMVSTSAHGVELLASTPKEVLVWVKRDTEKWGRIIRDAHITTD